MRSWVHGYSATVLKVWLWNKGTIVNRKASKKDSKRLQKDILISCRDPVSNTEIEDLSSG